MDHLEVSGALHEALDLLQRAWKVDAAGGLQRRQVVHPLVRVGVVLEDLRLHELQERDDAFDLRVAARRRVLQAQQEVELDPAGVGQPCLARPTVRVVGGHQDVPQQRRKALRGPYLGFGRIVVSKVQLPNSFYLV